MNFKDSYKKDMEQITPDKDFVRNLSLKLKEASEYPTIPAKSVRNKRTIFRYRYLAAAAVILLVFIAGTGAGIFINRNNFSDNSDNIGQQGVTETIVPTGEPIFDTKKWYEDCETEQDICRLFIQRLSDTTDLTKLYKNNENVFDDSMQMNQEDIRELVKLIQNGRVDYEEETRMESRKTEYYMAVFKNGDVIKFSIYNNCILKLKEFNFLIIL